MSNGILDALPLFIVDAKRQYFVRSDMAYGERREEVLLVVLKSGYAIPKSSISKMRVDPAGIPGWV